MNTIFDNEKLPLKCPSCGHTSQRCIASFKSNPRVPCGGCGQTIQVQADDLRRELDEMQRQLDRMGFKQR